MSSSDLIDGYITRVLTDEEQPESQAVSPPEEPSEIDSRELKLQQELKEAMDEDDKLRRWPWSKAGTSFRLVRPTG